MARKVLHDEKEVDLCRLRTRACLRGEAILHDVVVLDVPLFEFDRRRLMDRGLHGMEPTPARHGATDEVLFVALAELVDDLMRDLRAERQDALQQ